MRPPGHEATRPWHCELLSGAQRLEVWGARDNRCACGQGLMRAIGPWTERRRVLVGARGTDHGVVELLGADELDVGRDAVRRAEVERLLRLRRPAHPRPALGQVRAKQAEMGKLRSTRPESNLGWGLKDGEGVAAQAACWEWKYCSRRDLHGACAPLRGKLT
jgi:hypothetical protein